MLEAEAPGSPGPSSGRPSPRRRLAAYVAVAVVAALVGGGVASGVTLAFLRYRSQTLPIGTHVTVTEDDVATQVATRSEPAVVSLVTGTSEGNPVSGSGFVVDAGGYVVTNTQVVAHSTELTALLPTDVRRHDARLVGTDCETELAVLKIDGVSGLPTLPFADPNALQVGQTVVGLGGPISPRYIVSRGLVTGIHRSLSVPSPVDLASPLTLSDTIQTDVPIDSGNSGGPLLNVAGQVVGIDLAAGPAEHPTTLALSGAAVRPEVDEIVRTGQLVVPSLGAVTTDIGPYDSILRGVPQGALVRSVTAGGPAEADGIHAGDVIVQIDDAIVDGAHPLGVVLRTRFSPSQRVVVTVARGGSTTQLQLTLTGAQPQCA